MATRDKLSLKGKERYGLGKDWYDKATTISDTPYSAVLCQSFCVFESRKYKVVDPLQQQSSVDRSYMHTTFMSVWEVLQE